MMPEVQMYMKNGLGRFSLTVLCLNGSHFEEWPMFLSSHDMHLGICPYLLNGSTNLNDIGLVLQINFHRYSCITDKIAM
jgi:hypothetical protein